MAGGRAGGLAGAPDLPERRGKEGVGWGRTTTQLPESELALPGLFLSSWEISALCPLPCPHVTCPLPTGKLLCPPPHRRCSGGLGRCPGPGECNMRWGLSHPARGPAWRCSHGCFGWADLCPVSRAGWRREASRDWLGVGLLISSSVQIASKSGDLRLAEQGKAR